MREQSHQETITMTQATYTQRRARESGSHKTQRGGDEALMFTKVRQESFTN